MKVIKTIVLASTLSLLSASCLAMELEPLEDEELASVIGREGVSLDFEYRYNADGEGNPLASLDNCEQNMSGGPNPCSMAITVNNREGMWVMLKDMYGVQKINSLWLDGGGFVKDGDDLLLEYAGTSHALSNNHPDPERFQDGSGGCLLPGKSGNDCLADGLLGLVLQYEGEHDTFEEDVTWHLHIGRATVQFQDETTPEIKPYMQDNPGSFLTYQIRDFHQNEAMIDYDGRVIMFGF